MPALSRASTLALTGAGLALIAACYGLGRFAYGLFIPVFRDVFALDPAAAGLIASGSYAAYCVVILVATILTPRFGGRAVAVAAGAIATAGTLLIALAPNTAMLAAGVVLAGSSTGVASPPLAHAVARAVAEPVRNRTQTIINAGTGVGVAIAGPIALLTTAQWRLAWLTFAVLSALVTLWVTAAVPAERAGRARVAPGRTPVLFPSPLFPAGSGRLMTAAVLIGLASSATWTYGRDLLVTAGGMSAADSTLVWILLGACGVLGAAAGSLAGRLGMAGAWRIGVVVLAAGTALLAGFPGSLPIAAIAAGAFGAAYIALTGLLLIWGTEAYPRTPAAGVGLAFLLLAIGQAAGAPIVGAAVATGDPRVVFAVAALVALSGILIGPRRLRVDSKE
ncbi:MFS transporter [Agromyces silvae]|uniref:MFS transporter n=1 Tax=Agromyces silvae TaxID=3388266 RepID=UPI00280A4FC4|nr:MFS transporter [Agromyces protaetiae]